MLLVESLSHDFVTSLTDELCSLPPEERFVTVDTEFIRENLVSPLLCLIQLATPKEVFVIDAASSDVSLLNTIFEDKRIKKVFHSAQQDIEILSLNGIDIQNFYDTQLYEMVLSTREKISYQSIVLKYIDKKLKKSHSMSDWSQRPLSKKQLRYSVEDVLYLREVYKKQRDELIRLNRENWLDDELLSLQKKEEKNTSLFASINEKNIPVLNQLLEWRAQKAAQKEILLEEVVSDDFIKTVCKKGVELVRNVKNSRSVKDETFKEFLFFAEKVSDNLEIDKRHEGHNITFTVLRAVLDICSQESNVASSIIATSKDLEKLSEGEKDVKCMFGWRKEIFGNIALAVLRGEKALRVKGLEVVLE